MGATNELRNDDVNGVVHCTAQYTNHKYLVTCVNKDGTPFTDPIMVDGEAVTPDPNGQYWVLHEDYLNKMVQEFLESEKKSYFAAGSGK